jgi:hypothetical protein
VDTLRRKTICSFTLVALIMSCFSLVQQTYSQSDSQTLKVSNYSWYFDSVGGFHVVGEVQNVGTTILQPVWLGATIYTPDGTPQILSNPCRVYVSYMLPQQKAPFLMDFPLRDMSWMSQGIDRTEFTVIQADTNSSYQYPDVVVSSSTLSTDATGVYWVSGKVQNTGNRTATNVRVIGTFYNSTGTVVAAGYSEVVTPSNLSPSNSASFKVGAFDVNQTETTPDRQISSYTLLVQAEGPLLNGTIPPVSNSTVPISGSSTNSTSDDNSTVPEAPGLNYGAIIVVVIVIVAAALLLFSRRRSSKASTAKSTKPQAVGKRKQSPRNRRRDI